MVIGVIVGGIWGISKSIDRIMMEVYNVISNIPFIWLLSSWLTQWELDSGTWFLPCPDWHGSGLPSWSVSKSCVTVIWNTTCQSRTLGTPTLKIVTKNILPQLVSVIVTTMTQMLPSFISYEAFLSFFGLGFPITVPSLGRLISDYSQNVTTNAYLFWIPLTTLVLVSLSLS